MSPISPLEGLWKDHASAAFPESCRGRDVEGRDLELLAQEAEGCVKVYLGEAEGMAGMQEMIRPALEKCEADLDNVVPHLEGEGKEYFGRLWVLAKMVLEAL